MTELINAMQMDGQYAVERVHLDCKAFGLVPGSDESVALGDKTLVLKMKQQRLMHSVLDEVKMGLDNRFEEEDQKYLEIATFPTDHPEMEAEDMPTKITAVIIDKHVPKKHFDLKLFIDVLNSQPWMAKQAIEDVHLEETLRSKELGLDRLQQSLSASEREVEDNEKAIAAAKEKVTNSVIIPIVLSQIAPCV
jgi:hypothetical protein